MTLSCLPTSIYRRELYLRDNPPPASGTMCSQSHTGILEHWNNLPPHLYNLGSPHEKVGPCPTQVNPIIFGTHHRGCSASNMVLDHLKTYKLIFHSYLGWKVGSKKKRKVFLKFPYEFLLRFHPKLHFLLFYFLKARNQ